MNRYWLKISVRAIKITKTFTFKLQIALKKINYNKNSNKMAMNNRILNFLWKLQIWLRELRLLEFKCSSQMRNSSLITSTPNLSTSILSAVSVPLRQRQPLQAISLLRPPWRTTCLCKRKVPLSPLAWIYRRAWLKTRIESLSHHREEVINREQKSKIFIIYIQSEIFNV